MNRKEKRLIKVDEKLHDAIHLVDWFSANPNSAIQITEDYRKGTKLLKKMKVIEIFEHEEKLELYKGVQRPMRMAIVRSK